MEQVEKKKVILGDQYPPGGGLLRRQVLEKAGHLVSYFVQDIAPPWNCHRVFAPKLFWGFKSLRELGGYAAMGVNLPWTLETPFLLLQDPIQSLSLKRGFVGFVGPKTSQTAYGLNRLDPETYYGILDKLAYVQIQHASHLALLTFMDAERVPTASWVSAEKRRLQGLCTASSLVSEFFRDPPHLIHELPPNFFWEIDVRTGWRFPYRGGGRKSTCAYVPKGIALPLEFASRGFATGYTRLKYLSAVRRIRDQYIPGMEIPLCEIRFEWDPGKCITSTLVEVYSRKLRLHGRVWALKGAMPGHLKHLVRFWRNRPTSLSHAILGGDLNAAIKFHSL